MLSSAYPFVYQKSNNFVGRGFGDEGAAAEWQGWKSFGKDTQWSWTRRMLSTRKLPKAATVHITAHSRIHDALRTPRFVDVGNADVCYLTKSKETSRNVSVGAGRSKAKRKGYSGGRIESTRPKQTTTRKPAPGKQVMDAKPSVKESSMKHEGTSTQAHTDPSVRYPDEYYKYGPYGPYAWKAPVVGKHMKGTMGDKCVSSYNSVKDEAEHEEMDIYNACVNYDRRLRTFDENVGIKYFFVFVRQTWRVGWQIPWREWTLVSQVAVECDEELDKWRLGFRLDKRGRDAITKCTAWFRPDLIYIKRPRYQVRFEPQEGFINGLLELLDPENDWKGEIEQTYYWKLCCLLGVPLDAHEDHLVTAYEKLDEVGKLACLEHILCNHPVELLHPFNLAWCNKEKSNNNSNMQAETEFSDEDVEEEEFVNRQDTENENDDDDNEEEEEEEEDANDDWDEDEDADVEEGSSDNDDEDIELLEKRFNNNARIIEAGHENHLSDQDCRKEWEQALISETGRSWTEQVSQMEEDGNFLEVESKHNKDKIAEYKKGNVQVDDSELLLKVVVRPFTYVNMIKEIWLIRQMLVNNYRSHQKLLC